ncbi:hypothetical protein FAI41_03445 [Acetobacteraceae bacterium]|nr:hypothetical protein FAI41_03445 [Acetobacteraceae bacterium]
MLGVGISVVFSKTASVFSNVLKNAGKLLLGTVCAGILGLVYTLLAARTLSPAGLGVVALIFAWPRLIATIGTCQSWQVILHYGAIPLEQGDRKAVQRSFAFAFGLDLIAGLAGLLIGIFGIIFFSHALGFENSYLFYLAFFGCLIIPGRCLNNSMTGALRLFDRMGMIAREEPYIALSRLLMALLAWQMDWGVTGFVFAYGISMLIGQFYLIYACLKVLKEKGFKFAPSFRLLKLSKEMPKGVWELVLSSNFAQSVYSGMIPALSLVLGAFFGPAVVAFFTLADSFINAIGQPADLLERSYYPELTRLDIRKSELWFLLLKVEFLSALLAVAGMGLVWIGGEPLFAFFGSDYVAALPILVFMAPTLLFWLSTMPLAGVLYSAGRSKSAAGIQLIYVISMAFFMSIAIFYHSISGIGIAYSMANAVNILVYLLIVAHVFHHRKGIIPLHERIG